MFKGIILMAVAVVAILPCLIMLPVMAVVIILALFSIGLGVLWGREVIRQRRYGMNRSEKSSPAVPPDRIHFTQPVREGHEISRMDARENRLTSRPAEVRMLPLLRLARHLLGRIKVETSLIDQFRYSPFLVQMVVTRACNLRCSYCNEFHPQGRTVPVEQLLAQLDKIRSLGALAVEFTGGEPLLHPELAEIIRYATALDFPARMLISNAHLMTEKIVDDLNSAGLTDLQVSVDGIESNKITHKVLSSVEDQLRMISRKAEFRVQLSGVIGACPPDEVLEMVNFAVRMGFAPRILVIHDGKGQIKTDQENLMVLESAKDIMGRRYMESGDYRNRLLSGQPAPFKCRAGARYLYVDEFGNVHWCSQRQKQFSRPLMEYSAADLARQFHTHKTCNEFCTVGCARSVSRFDEWRNQEISDIPHSKTIPPDAEHG